MKGETKSLFQASSMTRCSSLFTDHHDTATTAHDGKNTEIPPEFICPITQAIMKIPLKSRYGHTYECNAILTWLANHSNLCPLTRRELNVTDLIRNRPLQERIEGWHRSHHPEMVNSSRNANYDDDIFPQVLITCRKSDFETCRSNNNAEMKGALVSETMMQRLSSVIQVIEGIDDGSQRHEPSGSERFHHRRLVPRILRLMGSSK